MTPDEKIRSIARIIVSQDMGPGQSLLGVLADGMKQFYEDNERDDAYVAANLAINQVARAIAALPAGEREWQPIETAPRDGTRFLFTNGRIMSTGFYINGHTFAADSWQGERNTVPSHWMPLPNPPDATTPEPSPAGETQSDHVLVPLEDLNYMLQYWNGNANEMAMKDALDNILNHMQRIVDAGAIRA